MSRPTDPHGWVESWAWPIIQRDHRLSTGAVLVLLQLASYGDAAGNAFPATRTLAKNIGRSDRVVRAGLDLLRQRGYIAGDVEPRRVTHWRFVIGDLELQNLRTPSSADGLRTPSSADALADQPPSADPGVRSSDDGICGPSADLLRTPGSAEVEVEGTSSSLSTALQDEGEGEEAFDLSNGSDSQPAPSDPANGYPSRWSEL